MMSLDQLTELLHSEIPLSKALGVRCDIYQEHQLTISAPLAPNINHKHTAFGGSIYSVAVICGWALINLALIENGLEGQVVIYQSEIKYHKPVSEDFCAISQKSATLTDPGFFNRLRRKGMRSIDLSVDIQAQGLIRATFTGRYVISLVRA